MTADLRELLHRTASIPTHVPSVAALEREARRRRRRRNLLGGAGLGLIAAAAAVISVIAIGGNPDRASIATISGGPTATPSTSAPPVAKTPFVTMRGLTRFSDGASIAVYGGGFIPDHPVEITECPENTDCDAFTPVLSVTADSQGAFAARVTLRSSTVIAAGGTMSCGHACFLFAHSLPETSNVGARTPDFTLDTPPIGVGPECPPHQLAASYGGGVSPETGEHSAIVNLRNSGQSTCWLYDYPTVQLLNNGSVLPFVTAVGGNYIFERPALVQLAPGASAHFVVAKYRCDAGAGVDATELSFLLPGGNVVAAVPLPGATASGNQLEFCESPGETAAQVHSDPGNQLQVGPLVMGAESGVG